MRPGNLLFTELTMNSFVYQSILKSDVKPSVRQLMLGPNWVMQRDNDPKHSIKSPTKNRVAMGP